MFTDIINILLGFIEGLALIVSPCILPILPLILSGSLTGSKKRPFGIIAGFILTFTIFTLFTRVITQAFHISPDIIRNLSLGLLLLLGIIMMSTYLTEGFNRLTQRLTRVGSQNTRLNDPNAGFFSGLLFGCLIGIIWTPCAGPILAAIIVQVAIQKTTFMSILTILAFALGAAIPMLLIALLGRRILKHFDFARSHSYLIRKMLGVLIILSVLLLAYNPSFGIVQEKNVKAELSGNQLINGLSQSYQAPAIAGITAWINSPPLSLVALKGKVVLIDFWTYSCINCIRTLPYLKDWYSKYHDQGLEIIGIHSPEFEFEHDVSNVEQAVKNDGIKYPVALDNNFVTWQNYHNNYWPAHYLINKEGEVVYTHFGEGEYDVTENNIRYLLGLAPMTHNAEPTNDTDLRTPETYLGYARMHNFMSVEKVFKDIPQTYTLAMQLRVNDWALKGKWLVGSEKIIAAQAGASLILNFRARHVYLVMGTQNKNGSKVKLLLNDEPLGKQAGSSVKESSVTVTQHQLYDLLQFTESTQGELQLIADAPGLELYAFTFG